MAQKKNASYIAWGVALGVVALTVTILLVKPRRKVDLSPFDSPDQSGSGDCMNPEFVKLLQQIEKKTGHPIFEWISSGARSEYWNKKVGGVKNSAHKIPNCRAADIKMPSKAIRDEVVKAAREVGIVRIGIGRTFLHLDNDPDKPQPVAWGYPIGNKPPYNPFT